MKPRYIGPNEVTGVTILEEKTPTGKEIVRVYYAGDKLPPEDMPMVTFELLVSDVPKDYNWLRETRYKKLLEEIAALCLEHDVSFSDVEYLTTSFKQKIAAAFDRATSYLWTKDDEQFIPGIPALSYRTLLEADRILKSIKSKSKEKDNGKTGTTDKGTSEGGK